jgi:hypothetical protein
MGAMREHVLPHVPRFRYIVDDLTQATDEQLNTRISSLYVRVVMLLFRDGRRLPVSLVLSQSADLRQFASHLIASCLIPGLPPMPEA